MGQAEIISFLESHKGNFFSAKQIFKEVTNKSEDHYRMHGQSVYRALRQLSNRNECDVQLIPSNKIGRGSNIIMLYGLTGGKRK